MSTLNLKDSQFVNGAQESNDYGIGNYCQAVDKLNKDLASENIETYSLSKNKSVKCIDGKLIWYEIDDSRPCYSSTVITKATFYTSHYIGFYSTKIGNEVVNINIMPRFGKNSKIFNYLISYAYGLYMPKGDSNYQKEQSSNYWLMAILWKASLEKSLSKSHIPKEYQKVEKNSRVFRGKLKISHQIKNNLTDESKVYCQYRKLSMDTTINRTVRYLYKLLEKKGFKNLLANIAEYDNKLNYFGVQSKEISITEIQNIRYSKLNKHYRQVMQLSTAILSNHLASGHTNADNNSSFSYFIDVAELWENYLLKVLQRKLYGYEVYSPNETGGEYLFKNESRQIRPDIIIKKDGNIVAILDAKYKGYDKIGKISTGYRNVSREDLYQMTTYLYHYGAYSDNIVGLFISPVEGICDDMLSLIKKPTHRIGVLNLNINQWDGKKNDESFLTEIETEENKFIINVKKALESCKTDLF